MLRISQVADALIARHIIGPMVLVMPAINGAGRDYQDCVNGPGVSDDTYLTQDVRADVFARYRVSHDPYEWGVTGYSSGGYCAANLALRHRRSFGAAAVIEGYFRAADGPAATRAEPQPAPGGRQQPAVPRGAAHPGQRPPAGLLGRGRHPRRLRLPAGDHCSRPRSTASSRSPSSSSNARDSGNAWQAALPTALAWLWQQLAPPDLRVLFPVRTTAAGLVAPCPSVR